MSYGYPGGDPNQGGYGQSGPQQPGGYGQSGPQQPGGYGQSGPQQPGGYGQGGPQQPGGYGQSGPQQPGGYGQGGYDPNQGAYGQSGPQQPGGYGAGGYGGAYGTGGGYGAGGGGQPPTNWLIPAIISIFCCWPLAIPGIIFATQVNSKWATGDYAGAEDSAKKAKTFSIIAFALGAAWVVIWLILMFAGVIGGSASSSRY